MSSAAERGRSAGRRGPPPALVNTDNVDGLAGVGMDTTDDLMTSLIDEAGGATDPDSIIATGLPDGYDPTAGFEGDGGGDRPDLGRSGKVFQLGDPPTREPIATGVGSTRVGFLRPLKKVEMPVRSHLDRPPSASDDIRKPPMAAPANDEIDGPEDEEESPSAESALRAADDLPDELDGGDLPTAVAAPPVEVDVDVMAELAEGQRAVEALSAARLSPVIRSPVPESVPEVSATRPKPSEPATTAVTFPVLRLVTQRSYPFGGIAMVVSKAEPPARVAWAHTLPSHLECFQDIADQLSSAIHAQKDELLAIYGQTTRHRALATLIRAVAGEAVSTAGRVGCRAPDGVRSIFSVSTQLYSVDRLTGLLLVGLEVGTGKTTHLTLFSPALPFMVP